MRRSIRAACGDIASCFRFSTTCAHVVTLREGNTPLLDGPIAAQYGGLDSITFKHQGFNPTGIVQGQRDDLRRVAGAPAGDDARGLRVDRQHVRVHGSVRGGGGPGSADLSAARKYFVRANWRRPWNTARARCEVEANFDQILALVRVLAERLGFTC